MAAGSLPTSPPLSINDINVAFYSASGTKTLSELASDVTDISLPAGVLDFLGCPYCQVYPTINYMSWEYNQIGSSNECTSYVKIIPKISDYRVFAAPSWLSIFDDPSSITMYPTQENSGAVKYGRVCLCACTASYQTHFICVRHCSLS